MSVHRQRDQYQKSDNGSEPKSGGSCEKYESDMGGKKRFVQQRILINRLTGVRISPRAWMCYVQRRYVSINRRGLQNKHY